MKKQHHFKRTNLRPPTDKRTHKPISLLTMRHILLRFRWYHYSLLFLTHWIISCYPALQSFQTSRSLSGDTVICIVYFLYQKSVCNFVSTLICDKSWLRIIHDHWRSKLYFKNVRISFGPNIDPCGTSQDLLS